MRAEDGSVYQTCQCVAGGGSPILQCDLDKEILVLKVGNCVCRTGWDGRCRTQIHPPMASRREGRKGADGPGFGTRVGVGGGGGGGGSCSNIRVH